MYNGQLFRGKGKDRLQSCAEDKCCVVVVLSKLLSLATVYHILGKSAEHACCSAHLKLSVLLKDISLIPVNAKKKTCSNEFTGLKISLFLIHSAHTSLTFLFCPMWRSPYKPNNCSLLITESLLWAITSEFPIVLMTLENIPPSVLVIIAQWNVEKWNDADVEKNWA